MRQMGVEVKTDEDGHGCGYRGVGRDENADGNRDGMKMGAEMKTEKGWEMQWR